MGRILIVEDHQPVSEIIAHALVERGHTAVEIGNGLGALQMLAQEPFHAAVVDLLLPDVQGSEVLKALWRANVPSIAMSGVFRSPQLIEQVIQVCGAQAFFPKPFDLAEMVNVLDHLAQMSQMAQAAAAPPPEPVLPNARPATISGSMARPVTSLSPTPPMVEAVPEEPDVVLEGEQVAPEEPAPLPARAAPPPEELEGSLATTSLVSLMARPRLFRAAGVLELTNGPVRKNFWFDRGVLRHVSSSAEGERFGAFLLAKNVLTAETLRGATEVAAREGISASEALARLGAVTAEQQRELMGVHARELFASSVGWAQGAYRFVSGLPPHEGLVLLQVPIAPLLAAALAQLSEEGLRARLPPETVLKPSTGGAVETRHLGFDVNQDRLAHLADGTKPASDLIQLAEVSEREGLALLCALREMGLLSVTQAPQPKPSARRIVMV